MAGRSSESNNNDSAKNEEELVAEIVVGSRDVKALSLTMKTLYSGN